MRNAEARERRKSEIVRLLLAEEYGFLPRDADEVGLEVLEEDLRFCAGKAPLRKIRITARFGERHFSFPCYSVIPSGSGKYPFFIS